MRASTPSRSSRKASKVLHITNGDYAAGSIREALAGEVLPWRDVLHEGPVPGGLPAEELNRLRARFLASCGWGDAAQIEAQFAARDEMLARSTAQEEVVLWFEPDLYDQLQLIQILDWFRGRDLRRTRLFLIQAVRLSPDLFSSRREVGPQEIELAARAWRAFTSSDPREILRVADADTSALPHLKGALERHCEQFPSTHDGLSRTERQVLRAVAAGARDRHAIFLEQQKREEFPFLGDASLWLYLDRLETARTPLLAESSGKVELTADGEDVLAGIKDCVRLNGIHRWLGGVHLAGDEAEWRWDQSARLLQHLPA